MKKAYYILAIQWEENGKFSPEFGSFDREEIRTEKESIGEFNDCIELKFDKSPDFEQVKGAIDYFEWRKNNR